MGREGMAALPACRMRAPAAPPALAAAGKPARGERDRPPAEGRLSHCGPARQDFGAIPAAARRESVRGTDGLGGGRVTARAC